MRRLRTASSPRLLAIVAVLVAVVAGAGIAQAALNSATKPAPKALDRAVLDAFNAPPVQGVTARIEFMGLRFIQPYLKPLSVVQIAAAFMMDPPATVGVGPA